MITNQHVLNSKIILSQNPAAKNRPRLAVQNIYRESRLVELNLVGLMGVDSDFFTFP